MDLRAYYRKIRDLEATLKETDVVIVSLATPDGGQDGTKTEVARRVACQLVVEGKARFATPEESADYREATKQAHREAQAITEAKRMQIGVLSEKDITNFRQAVKNWNRGNPEAS